MSDYIEEEYIGWIDYSYDDSPIPIVDQNQEIVRCKDCKFRCFDECTRIDEDFKDRWFAIEPDGFCAWAEREE